MFFSSARTVVLLLQFFEPLFQYHLFLHQTLGFLLIRKDLLDKHSIAEPRNLEEFETMLYTLKEKEFGGSGQYVWAGPLECIEGTLFGYYTDTPSDILVEGKIRPKYYGEAYKRMLEDIYQWILDGIIDKSMLSDNLFGSANLYAQGKVGMLASSIMGYEYNPGGQEQRRGGRL